MFRQSTNQNHYPVFGKWWCHCTALTAGRFRRCWEEKTTRSIGWNLGYSPLKLRIVLLPVSEIVNAPVYRDSRAWFTCGVALQSQKRDCSLCTWHKPPCWRRTGTRQTKGICHYKRCDRTSDVVSLQQGGFVPREWLAAKGLFDHWQSKPDFYLIFIQNHLCLQ